VPSGGAPRGRARPPPACLPPVPGLAGATRPAGLLRPGWSPAARGCLPGSPGRDPRTSRWKRSPSERRSAGDRATQRRRAPRPARSRWRGAGPPRCARPVPPDPRGPDRRAGRPARGRVRRRRVERPHSRRARTDPSARSARCPPVDRATRDRVGDGRSPWVCPSGVVALQGAAGSALCGSRVGWERSACPPPGPRPPG
jgi:hypothetical protein